MSDYLCLMCKKPVAPLNERVGKLIYVDKPQVEYWCHREHLSPLPESESACIVPVETKRVSPPPVIRPPSPTPAVEAVVPSSHSQQVIRYPFQFDRLPTAFLRPRSLIV